jgi:hypothetical protein
LGFLWAGDDAGIAVVVIAVAGNGDATACPERRRPDGDSALTQASTCVKLSYLEEL